VAGSVGGGDGSGIGSGVSFPPGRTPSDVPGLTGLGGFGVDWPPGTAAPGRTGNTSSSRSISCTCACTVRLPSPDREANAAVAKVTIADPRRTFFIVSPNEVSSEAYVGIVKIQLPNNDIKYWMQCFARSHRVRPKWASVLGSITRRSLPARSPNRARDWLGEPFDASARRQTVYGLQRSISLAVSPTSVSLQCVRGRMPESEWALGDRSGEDWRTGSLP